MGAGHRGGGREAGRRGGATAAYPLLLAHRQGLARWRPMAPAGRRTSGRQLQDPEAVRLRGPASRREAVRHCWRQWYAARMNEERI